MLQADSAVVVGKICATCHPKPYLPSCRFGAVSLLGALQPYRLPVSCTANTLLLANACNAEMFYTSSSHELQATCMKGMHQCIRSSTHVCVWQRRRKATRTGKTQRLSQPSCGGANNTAPMPSIIASVPTGLGRSLQVLPIMECMQGAMWTHCTA